MKWMLHLDESPECINHGAVVVDGNIYAFNGPFFSDYKEYEIWVNVLNTSTLRWSTIPPQRVPVMVEAYEMPSPLFLNTVVTYNKKIYVWGGISPVLYCFDPKTTIWSRPTVTGTIPFPRDGHSSCVYGNLMYMFGGYLGRGNQKVREVHTLNLETFEWKHLETFGTPPPGQHTQTAVVIQNRMYVFGGISTVETESSRRHFHNENIFYLDLETNTWHHPTNTGDKPLGRNCHSMVVYKGKIYVYGGYNSKLNKWFDDLVSFDTQSNVWTKIQPLGKCPTARQGHGAVVVDDYLYMFSGVNIRTEKYPTYLKETHVLHFSASLRSLAIAAAIKYNLDTSLLPKKIRDEIKQLAN